MEKGDLIKITIEDISNEGAGIGRADGMAVFVKGTVPGDKVTAEITKLKKSYAFATMITMDEPSPSRIEPDCPYFGMCGGCSMRHITYEAELAIKEKQVRDKITRLAGIKDAVVRDIIGMEDPWYYRNKGTFPISTDGIKTLKGGIVVPVSEPKIGFFSRKTHDVVNVDECFIQNPVALACAKAVKQYMEEDHITSYDPRWDKGLMKNMTVKVGSNPDAGEEGPLGEVMVIFEINGRGIPDAEKLIEYLDEYIYESGYSLESVVVNKKKEKKNQETGQKTIVDDYQVIAGKETILSECMGLNFEISPSAFYQTNPVQTEKLYSKAIEYAGITGDETVFDLYCGVGTIGIIVADHMKNIGGSGKVYGIELDKGAVLNANRNAVINNLVNVEFLQGKAEEKIDELIYDHTDRDGFEVKGKRPDVVIVDPPRAGCDERLLKTIKEISPEKLVYVSCDPATLARDIKILTSEEGGGYTFIEATPVDMFPRTSHVETVVLLVRA